MNLLTKTILMLNIWISPSFIHAQWRLGSTFGATLNHFTFDKQYMEDRHFCNGWGVTAGFSSQFDFLESRKWRIGIRSDLSWILKDYRVYWKTIYGSFVSTGKSGDIKTPMSYYIFNHYIQLPIMVSIRYGRRLSCSGVLGCYGAYWLYSSFYGVTHYGFTELDNYTLRNHFYTINFNSQRDQRFEYGFVGGIGCEWPFREHWTIQIQTLWYHGLTSTQKDYMIIKSPRYNDTFVLQAGMFYNF